MKFIYLALLLAHTAWAQPDPTVRHATETDKAAIFGYMINARGGEMRGNSIKSIYTQCLLPSLICAFLTPLYFRLAGRGENRTS